MCTSSLSWWIRLKTTCSFRVALGDPVGFGLSDEGEAGRHAEERQLVLEVLGHEPAAVVMKQQRASRAVGLDGAAAA